MNNREFILEKTFEQYIEHGYEDVSISILQNATNLGRATIYYHFSNKENLFKEVINEYVARPIYSFLKNASENNINISTLIELYKNERKEIATLVYRVNPKLKITNYLSLMLYAYSHDNEFGNFIDNTRTQLRSIWNRAIQNSINMGELPNSYSSDMLTPIFCGLDNFASWDITAEDGLAGEDPFSKNCLHLFTLLKTKDNK